MPRLKKINEVTAKAYASVSNLCVGFDALGFPVGVLFDEVTLKKRKDNQIIIQAIKIDKGELPFDIDKNTATVALKKFCEKAKIKEGFDVFIKKGIPLCSGLGGSAASIVAALTAINHFLVCPFSLEVLAKIAISAEAVSSGQMHADNVVPSLYGGLTLISSLAPLSIKRLPIPRLFVSLLLPDFEIPTELARKALSKNTPLEKAVQQSANMGLFISSLYENDLALLQKACVDKIIEKQRAHLLPGFYDIQKTAKEKGALACSFSGAGPCIFAFAKNENAALAIGQHMQKAIEKKGIAAKTFVTKMQNVSPLVTDEKND